MLVQEEMSALPARAVLSAYEQAKAVLPAAFLINISGEDPRPADFTHTDPLCRVPHMRVFTGDPLFSACLGIATAHRMNGCSTAGREEQ